MLFFNQTCSSIYFKTLEAVSQVQGEQREIETSCFRTRQQTRKEISSSVTDSIVSHSKSTYIQIRPYIFYNQKH